MGGYFSFGKFNVNGSVGMNPQFCLTLKSIRTKIQYMKYEEMLIYSVVTNIRIKTRVNKFTEVNIMIAVYNCCAL